MGNSLFSLWGVNTNKAMVEYMQKNGVIRSKKVAEVMETIDRALFIPDGIEPYHSRPVSHSHPVLEFYCIIPAPNMHSRCLELLEKHLQPGMCALDACSGTGYLTACFALMVGPQGRAVGVNQFPEMVSSSIQNIQKSAAAPLLMGGSLSMHCSGDRLDWPQHAPYDAIHVVSEDCVIPQAITDQLKPGGRLVWGVLLPGSIVESFWVIDKNLDGSLTHRDDFSRGTLEF
ncbi:protein-L-isoaspartate O-methyltransferase-like [Corylus avellana]|uniref:protein-L-isoaspartate O-methyltransferase-like n=1 Tax=Corylus avellana TaxID=13451 RepID=UPI00286A0F35|nr:protein-L-isoaspartate O-methyltransferase-like [Corylus avellana]